MEIMPDPVLTAGYNGDKTNLENHWRIQKFFSESDLIVANIWPWQRDSATINIFIIIIVVAIFTISTTITIRVNLHSKD